MAVYDPLETVWGLGVEGGELAAVRVTAAEEVLAGWGQARGYAWMTPLAYPLPAALAEEVGAVAAGVLARGERRLARVASAARRGLAGRGLPSRFATAARDLRGVRGEGLPPGQEVSAVRAALTGRRLLATEIGRFLAPGLRLFPEQVTCALEYLRLTGEVRAEPALAKGPGGWRCARCGSRRIQPSPCLSCGDPACPLCVDCSVLGEVRACRRLYWTPAVSDEAFPPVIAGDPSLPPSLTEAQRGAAAALLAWLHDPGSPRPLLLWAVCGAGKTLVVRPLVELAAASGWRVLYASPRREVIRQVAADLPPHALTLLTTHQALRYEAAFDLIILDEPDAFPYRGNPLLERAVERAGRPGARRVYLTATPDDQMLAAVEAGEMAQVLLARRHHGQPAPVPELLDLATAAGRWRGEQGETRLAAELVAHRPNDGRQVLLFAPTVDLCRTAHGELARRLTALGSRERVEWVHSGHPDRETLIESFRRGTCRVLVSTSVLERGVTFPAVDVIVLYADHPLFDLVSLVQMAGRAGRTSSDPFGQVWFIGARISPAMLAARRWITAMNEAGIRQ